MLRGVAAPWWIGGGWALELALGLEPRAHRDLDVVMFRPDAPALARHLTGWDLRLARAGSLRPWDGRHVEPEEHAFWVRRSAAEPWLLDVKLEAVEDGEWVYRRDPRVRRPVTEIGVEIGGLPLLRPEIALLYALGSNDRSEAPQLRAATARLAPEAAAWLEAALSYPAP